MKKVKSYTGIWNVEKVLYSINDFNLPLDVSKNTALGLLQCQNTNISSLDVSKNTALKYLYCNSTNISSLDVSNNN